jgi:hypothetical protein
VGLLLVEHVKQPDAHHGYGGPDNAINLNCHPKFATTGNELTYYK